jgi:hypothetical protein
MEEDKAHISCRRGHPQMAKASDIKKTTGISDNAVRTKTGKTWAEWFSVLDKTGAQKMKHSEIAEPLHAKHACPPWWSQMVTVGYERARCLREKHQTATGYSKRNPCAHAHKIHRETFACYPS